MIPFNLWAESFIFAAIYAVVILVPCALVTWIGRDMINQLGRWPTKTPAIQMGIFWKLVVIEVVTFIVMTRVFQFFLSIKKE